MSPLFPRVSPGMQSASSSGNQSQSHLSQLLSSLLWQKHLSPTEAVSCAQAPQSDLFPGITKELSQPGEESMRVTAQRQLVDSWKKPGSETEGEPERGPSEPHVCSDGYRGKSGPTCKARAWESSPRGTQGTSGLHAYRHNCEKPSPAASELTAPHKHPRLMPGSSPLFLLSRMLLLLWASTNAFFPP